MSNTKNTYSTKITNKVRSSLVIKLNVRMLGRLFFGFLAINILIFTMGLFIVLWKAEEGAQNMFKTIELSTDKLQSSYHSIGNYQILGRKRIWSK